MRQIENKTRGGLTGFNGKRGARKMRAANLIAKGERIAQRADDLAARNAYRLACGLPLLDLGNGSFTKARDRD